MDILHATKRVGDDLLSKRSSCARKSEEGRFDGIMRLDDIHGACFMDVRFEDRGEQVAA